VIRGTFHAGGFFAPGHLLKAAAAMPHLSRLEFRNCKDLKPARLQEVVDARVCAVVDVIDGSNLDRTAYLAEYVVLGVSHLSSRRWWEHLQPQPPQQPPGEEVSYEEYLAAYDRVQRRLKPINGGGGQGGSGQGSAAPGGGSGGDGDEQQEQPQQEEAGPFDDLLSGSEGEEGGSMSGSEPEQPPFAQEVEGVEDFLQDDGIEDPAAWLAWGQQQDEEEAQQQGGGGGGAAAPPLPPQPHQAQQGGAGAAAPLPPVAPEQYAARLWVRQLTHAGRVSPQHAAALRRGRLRELQSITREWRGNARTDAQLARTRREELQAVAAAAAPLGVTVTLSPFVTWQGWHKDLLA
jgi:hypothetical protein